MTTVAIVQARMGSTRLPDKVMKKINGVPLIELLLHRLDRAELVDKTIIATSLDPRNQVLVDCVSSLGYACERGSENNVLERYVEAAKKHSGEVVVRITGDCPLVDPRLVDQCITLFLEKNVDYLCNNHPETFPDGLDIEVVKLEKEKERCQW